MKILHINNTYKPVGGAEVYLHSLSNTFKEKGHEIFLFAIDDEKDIEENNLFVYRDIFKRGIIKYFLWYYLNPSLYYRLRKYIKKVNPDVIHIHNNGQFTSSILLALQGANVPVVQTVHDHTIICPTSFCIKLDGAQCDGHLGLKCPMSGCISWARYAYQRLPEYIKHYLLKITVDVFISPSKALQYRLKKNGMQNVVYLPNFIDVEKIIYDINKIEYGNVLYVGRLSKEKGVDCLIRAFPKIIKAFPSSRLNIVGDGPILSQLLKLASDLNVERHVTFHGRLIGAELMAEYQKANVVMVPSVCVDNSPNVIYEAMATGRPTIGSNIGGIPDLIMDAVTGFLVEPGNIDQISKKVIQIISNRELTIRMGKKARDKCFTEYCSEIHYTKILELYQKKSQKTMVCNVSSTYSSVL